MPGHPRCSVSSCLVCRSFRLGLPFLAFPRVCSGSTPDSCLSEGARNPIPDAALNASHCSPRCPRARSSYDCAPALLLACASMEQATALKARASAAEDEEAKQVGVKERERERGRGEALPRCAAGGLAFFLASFMATHCPRWPNPAPCATYSLP